MVVSCFCFQPGFYTTLLTVFVDHSMDVNIRWQAVLYFKNGVDRSVSHQREKQNNSEETEHSFSGIGGKMLPTVSVMRKKWACGRV